VEDAIEIHPVALFARVWLVRWLRLGVGRATMYTALRLRLLGTHLL
jgi:hypothetical protein